MFSESWLLKKNQGLFKQRRQNTRKYAEIRGSACKQLGEIDGIKGIDVVQNTWKYMEIHSMIGY